MSEASGSTRAAIGNAVKVELGCVNGAVVTDRLRSYSAALPGVLPRARHKRGHWLNNRAEHSHRPTRERERDSCCPP